MLELSPFLIEGVFLYLHIMKLRIAIIVLALGASAMTFAQSLAEEIENVDIVVMTDINSADVELQPVPSFDDAFKISDVGHLDYSYIKFEQNESIVLLEEKTIESKFAIKLSKNARDSL